MKKKFIIFIILVSALAVALMTSGVLATHSIKNHLQKNLVDDYASEETTIGNELALSVTDRFNNTANSLKAIAIDPNIQSLNPAVCNPSLQNYYTTLNLGIGNLGRVNPQGVFYCTINKALLGKKASSLGSYVQTLFNDPQHRAVVSREIKVPNVTGYVVAIHEPVYNSQHQFAGSIGGAVYLNQIASQVFSKVRFAQTGYASVQDDNGDIIYSHKTKHIGLNYFSAAIQNQSGEQLQALTKAIYAARQGHSSTVKYVALGVPKIAAVVPVTIVPNHRWIITVSVPEKEIAATFIHSGLNNAFNIVLLVIGLVLVILLFLLITTTWTSYKLQQAKDQFVSLVSHQLRTPLTAIRLFSEMLSDPAVGKLNTKQKEYVEKVHLSTIRMISLVGDILNVSRIELKRLKVEPQSTDMVAFIQSEIDEIRPLADEKKITLEVHMPPHDFHSNIDQTLYGQIIHNLLTNAVRYAPETGGVITISLLNHTRRGSEFIVADNGIGIPLKAQKKIFERFYRADNAMRAIGDGTGLGLYLVKMILNTVGGKIWFKSTENKGTIFHVTIPAAGMKPTAKEMKK